jgi:hypothetical protein
VLPHILFLFAYLVTVVWAILQVNSTSHTKREAFICAVIYGAYNVFCSHKLLAMDVSY